MGDRGGPAFEPAGCAGYGGGWDTQPADYIPVAAVEPGMTGYGLTVFSGSRIDTFSVKVVGIQHHARHSGS